MLTPLLITGSRAVLFTASLNVGGDPLAQATPASTNGAISVGRYGKLISPYCDTPNTGMRISKFAAATLLPTSLSKAGQPVVSPPLLIVGHSLALNEFGSYPRTKSRYGSPR